MKHGFFLAALAAILISCNSESTTYEVTGVVQEVRDERTVVIDHEEIPGFMMQMVMPFKVKEPSELEGLEPGQQIKFDYIVESISSWIENVEPTGSIVPVKEPDEVSAETAEKRVKVGEVLPDYEFFDEFGNSIKLSDHHGKPVALTFVFSQCPVPEYCPRMMNHFAAADELLKADKEAPEDYQLLTISFDSFNDTPEVMKNWGEAYNYSPGQWSLLSSDSCCTINEIAANVGLLFGEEDNGSYKHNLRTVVLDGEGRVTKIFTDENWEPQDLVEAIKSAAKTS